MAPSRLATPLAVEIPTWPAADPCAPQILRPSVDWGPPGVLSGRAGDQAGAEAYWRHAAPPPLMALHDPPRPVRCRHAGRLCGDVSFAAGGGELVRAQATGTLPRAPRQAETAGSGHARGACPALTPAGLAR